MNDTVAKHAPDAAARNIGEVLEDALLQAKTLIQAELSLARRELSSELQGALGSLLLLGVAAMFVQAALVTLGVWLLLAFGVGVAALAVVVGFAIIGGACALVAVRTLGKSKLPRTTARLALDTQKVLETVK